MAMDNAQGIVIIGGGMVGISLALMLSKALSKTHPRMPIVLIEKCPFPEKNTTPSLQSSLDTRATALSAGSVKLLQDIDCWQALSHQAEPISDIHISDRGHYAGTLLHASDYAVDALGYVVENSALGQCLLQQLHATTVKCIAPATVEQCRFTRQGVELSLQQNNVSSELVSNEKNKILQADLVLIADGADSPLSKSLGIETQTTQYQQSAIITNVALAKPHKGTAYERFTDQGPLALLPLGDRDGMHRASVVWTRETKQIDGLMQLSDEGFLQQLQHCFGYRADHILQVGKRQVYPLQLLQATEQVRSHLVLMGNAAHFLHPVAGQGFNLSLRDCATLASVLSSSATLPSSSSGSDCASEKYTTYTNLGDYKILKEYLSRRETDQQLTVGLTHALVNTFSSSKLSVSVLRQCGLLSLQALPRVKTQLAQQMMGM
ncbi:MAG: 2-polyprenyl-6-methoxyphenol 4-hydroxylase [Kiritimatiellia bacterium]|jgi:2-polyprenyl-6-methoxyphenol 4-hydroxylase